LPASSFRLPRSVVPDHYDITLDLDLESFAFNGEVGIDVRVEEPISQIVLNTADIDIKEAFLTAGPERLSITGISYDEKYERATLTLDGEVAPGAYRLVVDYTGEINDQLEGLYRSVYKDTNGQRAPDRHLAMPVDRRPPHLPLLGRARFQGDLSHHDDRP
jgi:aminopeptidase N